MKSRTVVEGSQRTFVLVLDSGEEAFKAITAFSGAQNISGASVTAIGAFAQAKVGWFDFETKNYVPIAVETQCEVLSLLGDVARGDDGKASLHLHAVLGLKDGTVRGGHLLEGKVRPTLELTITETAARTVYSTQPCGLRLRRRPGTRGTTHVTPPRNSWNPREPFVFSGVNPS